MNKPTAKTTKLQASSILEVVVSLVLITIIFTIAFMIYGNVLRSGISVQQIKAAATLANMVEQTQRDKRFFDEEITTNEQRIVKTVKKFENAETLYQVQLQLWDAENRLLASHNEVLLVTASDSIPSQSLPTP